VKKGDRIIDAGGHTGTVDSIDGNNININIDGFRGQESASVTTFDWASLSALHIMPGLTRLVQSYDEEYWVYNYQDQMFMGFGVVLEGTAPNLIPRLHTFITTAAGELDNGYMKVGEAVPTYRHSIQITGSFDGASAGGMTFDLFNGVADPYTNVAGIPYVVSSPVNTVFNVAGEGKVVAFNMYDSFGPSGTKIRLHTMMIDNGQNFDYDVLFSFSSLGVTDTVTTA
jgi:hypothetical protein